MAKGYNKFLAIKMEGIDTVADLLPVAPDLKAFWPNIITKAYV